MGFLDGLLGNASQIDAKELEGELEPVLIENEQVEAAYKVIRDFYVFTNMRLIFVDKQGLTGKKVEYNSIPYKSITSFSVETAGRFDMDAELKLWISGHHQPVKKEFKKGTDVVGIQKSLARHTLSPQIHSSSRQQEAKPVGSDKGGAEFKTQGSVNESKETLPITPLPADPSRSNICKAQCGKCGYVMTYQDKYAGSSTKCKECDNQFTLP